jgi:hypothetical protein
MACNSSTKANQHVALLLRTKTKPTGLVTAGLCAAQALCSSCRTRHIACNVHLLYNVHLDKCWIVAQHILLHEGAIEFRAGLWWSARWAQVHTTSQPPPFASRPPLPHASVLVSPTLAISRAEAFANRCECTYQHVIQVASEKLIVFSAKESVIPQQVYSLEAFKVVPDRSGFRRAFARLPKAVGTSPQPCAAPCLFFMYSSKRSLCLVSHFQQCPWPPALAAAADRGLPDVAYA